MFELAKRDPGGDGEALAWVSHEIRTPLSGILGLAGLLEHSELTAPQQRHVSLLRQATRDLMALLDDLLDFERLRAARLELEATDFGLRECLAGCLALVRAGAGKRVSLRLEVGADVPDMLRGDPLRLRQVLHNLLFNAARFAAGQVQVRVRALPSLPQGDVQLAVSVEDDGPGIPAERQAAIFDAFRQGGAEVARTHGGVGLGLAICARLVALMGGRLGVRSQPGRGSCFHFTARMGLAAQVSPASPAGSGHLRVLAADDDRVSRTLLEELLGERGCRVVMAADGEAALEAWRKGRFDLVLLDLRMPSLDGAAVAAAIRAEEVGTGRRVPLVALTASVGPRVEEQCREAGMDRYLAKPIVAAHLDLLLEMVRGNEPFAMSDALERTGGNAEVLRLTAESFVATARRDLRDLREAVQTGDRPGVEMLAHRLKGGASILAARECSRLASDLEEAAARGAGDLEGGLHLLEAAVARLERCLRARGLVRAETAGGGLQETAGGGLLETRLEEVRQVQVRNRSLWEAAARVQRSLLPRRPPRGEGFEFAWLYECSEGVAGDMLGLFRLDGRRLGLYVLDVSGHGAPAALLSVSLSRVLHPAWGGLVLENGRPAAPSEVVRQLNRRFQVMHQSNQYFTFLYAILDRRKRTLTFACAGHPRPVVVSRQGAAAVDAPPGIALGIYPEVDSEDRRIELEPGSRVFLYTDGVTETRTPEGEPFGLQRLVRAVARERGDLRLSLRQLRRGLRRFSQRRECRDDRTVLAFRVP